MVTDISERRRVEEALRTNREELALILSNVNEIVYRVEIDPATGNPRTTFLSPRVEQILGYQAEDLVRDPESGLKLIHPEDLAGLLEGTREVIERGAYLSRRYRVLHGRTGQYRWVEDSVSPQFDREGRVTALIGASRDITEQIQAQAARLEQEEVYRELFEGHTAFMILADPATGNIIDANQAAARFYGYGRDQMRAMTVSDLTAAPSEHLANALDEAREGRSHTFTCQHRLASGEVRQVRIYSSPIDIQGRRLLYSIITDCTEELQAETRYQTILRTAMDGFWVLDDEGRIVEVNDAYCEMLGFARDEVVGKQIIDFRADKSSDKVKEQMRLAKERGSMRYESQHVTQDGRVLDLEVSVKYMPIGKGQYCSFIHNVTERKRGEAQNRQLLKDLNGHIKELERQALIFATIHDAVILMGLDRRIIDWNPAAERISGYRKREVIGRRPKLLLHPETNKGCDREMREALKAEGRWTGELAFVRKDGVEGVADVTLVVQYDAQKKPLSLLAVCRDITSRKLAEEARRRIELLLAKSQEMAALGSWENDLITDRLTWSEETYRIFGRAPNGHHLRADDFYRCVQPADLETVCQISQTAIDSGDTYNVEHRIIRPGGEERVVRQQAEIIKDEAGRAVRMVGIVQDVTEQRREEAARRESESRYGTLVETAHDIIFTLDTAGQIVSLNRAFETVTGYPRSDWLGHSYSRLIHPDDLPRVMDLYDCAVRGVQPPIFETRIRTRQGGYAVVEVSAAPLLREGRVTSVIGVSRDVTDRKRDRAALEESEERYRRIVDHSPSGMAVHRDGEIIFINQAGARLLGSETPEDIIGLPLLNFIAPEEREEARSRIQEASWEGKPVILHDEQMIRLDGELVEVEAAHIPTFYDGTPAVLVEFTDVTERKRLEEQFRQAQKMEAVGRLAAGVAHDFNNLLSAITGYSDVLLQRLDENSPRRREVMEISKAAERAASLTGQLLAFSRKQILQPKVLDLNQVVADISRMLRRLIGEDIDLQTIPCLPLWKVEVDPGQVEQILMNLSVNARDAMPQGGRIVIETKNLEIHEEDLRKHPRVGVKPGRYSMLAVSDTGCGMNEETKGRIFEPFFTTKELGQGTGLGLSTVYGIIEQSNGYIWVYSEPNKGTTFEIYLPAIQDRPETAPAGSEAGNCEGDETILLVEDEEGVRSSAATILQMYGYHVLQAENGRAALDLCEQYEGPIHLILTDVVMPLMSGRELVEALNPLRPQMKVVYMSGYVDDAVIRHGVSHQEAAFLQKPLRAHQLARMIRQVLDHPDPGKTV